MLFCENIIFLVTFEVCCGSYTPYLNVNSVFNTVHRLWYTKNDTFNDNICDNISNNICDNISDNICDNISDNIYDSMYIL